MAPTVCEVATSRTVNRPPGSRVPVQRSAGDGRHAAVHHVDGPRRQLTGRAGDRPQAVQLGRDLAGFEQQGVGVRAGLQPCAVDPVPEIQVRGTGGRRAVVLGADEHGVEFEGHPQTGDQAFDAVRLDVPEHQVPPPRPADERLGFRVVHDRDPPGAHLLRVVVQGGGGRNRGHHPVGPGPLPQRLRDRTAAHFAAGDHEIAGQAGGPRGDRPHRGHRHRLVVVNGLGVVPEQVHGPRADVDAEETAHTAGSPVAPGGCRRTRSINATDSPAISAQMRKARS